MDINNQQVNQQVTLNENNLALVAHLSGLIAPVIGPIIFFILFKDSQNNMLKQNTVNVFNWNMSLIIYSMILGAIFGTGILSILFIGFFLFLVLGILNLIFSILGAIEANKGGVYKYPMTIEFIK
jgi:uncharacterized Tic20 family protein